ncbi:MAG: hypothetical protein QXT64_04230 [Desulfurococcaceae archaeon]
MKWDKGVDYDAVYSLLLKSIRKKKERKDRRLVSLCYDFILLLQLRNGLRISEAVRAFKQYILTRKNELEVNVSKKKRREMRLVIVPEIGFDTSLCVDLVNVDDDVLVKRIKSYASGMLKINTHSLRYAFITYLLRQGVNPSIVAKITKHSKLDFILSYTQEKTAEDILRNI